MNRRDLLRTAAGLGCGTVVGGFLVGRNAYVRSRLREKLAADATAGLLEKELGELRELPARARDQVTTWFHAPCLNAAEFAFAVTSADFAERLAAVPDEDARTGLFLAEFLRHVVTEEEILNEVRLVAKEVGDELDLNWERHCREVAGRWDLHLREYGPGLADDLAVTLEPLVRQGVDESARLARGHGRTALSNTVTGVGASAVLLLPLAPVSSFAVPLFVVVAVGHLYRHFRSQEGTAARVREAVSRRMALLAVRVGAEFQTEVRTAVGRLHDWQRAAVRCAAAERAERAVPSFF